MNSSYCETFSITMLCNISELKLRLLHHHHRHHDCIMHIIKRDLRSVTWTGAGNQRQVMTSCLNAHRWCAQVYELKSINATERRLLRVSRTLIRITHYREIHAINFSQTFSVKFRCHPYVQLSCRKLFSFRSGVKYSARRLVFWRRTISHLQLSDSEAICSLATELPSRQQQQLQLNAPTASL